MKNLLTKAADLLLQVNPLIVFALILGAVAVVQSIRIKQKSIEVKNLQGIITDKDSEIKVWRNEHGELVAQNERKQMTIDQFSKFYNEHLLKVSRDFDIKQSQLKRELQEYIQAGFSAHNSGSSVVNNHYHYDSAKRDTVRAQEFSINDGYLSEKVTIVPGKALWDYTYTDTLTAIGRRHKKWLFGKETFLIDAKLSNPKSGITSLHNYEIKEFRDKRFSVGPALIVDIQGRPVLGFGVSWSLIRF